MKLKQKLLPVTVIITLLLTASCNFSKGIKKDLTTGLTTSYNGFALDDIYLANEDEHKLKSNAVSLGSKITIIATGVNNYTEKEGNVFPGCSILLTDKTGKEILNLADAFAEMTQGVLKENSGKLRAQLNTGDPMRVGETYHLLVRFYDKNKKENEIVADADIVMKE